MNVKPKIVYGKANLIWIVLSRIVLLLSTSSALCNLAAAQEFVTDDGYPCNVFLNQPGVDDAAGNYADFIVNPDLPTQVTSFIAGEVAEYLTVGFAGKNVSQFSILKPIGFYLRSTQIGAKFGVDVCIPPLSLTSADVLDWNVTVSPSVVLNPSPDDWFTQTSPKISIEMLASNCGSAAGTAMALGPAGSCNVFGTSSINLQVPAPVPVSPQFKFKLVANREAVIRFTIEEQSGVTLRSRRNNLDAGQIRIEMIDPPIPLTIDDLNKLENFSPDPTYTECFPQGPTTQNRLNNFNNFVYFDGIKLQGPSGGTRLDWLGKDVDDLSPISGNKSSPFSIPINIIYQNGTNNVISFEKIYLDNDGNTPGNGTIKYDYTIDKVYRDLSNNVFASATVSRDVSGIVHQCRVWFKRSQGMKCSELPDIPLPPNPIIPIPSSGFGSNNPMIYASIRTFCDSF